MFIRGRIYSPLSFQMRRLLEGGVYKRAAFKKGNMVSHEEKYSVLISYVFFKMSIFFLFLDFSGVFKLLRVCGDLE